MPTRDYMMDFMVVWLLLLSSLSSCSGIASDIQCLQELKESVSDPTGALSSWKFSENGTEGNICQFAGVSCWNPSDSRVLSLCLRNMGLQGSFPRGIQNCRPLPGDISLQLRYIQDLNLSYNGFSGEIPPGIGNLTYLSSLSLQHNRFTGRIPEKIGKLAQLTTLNVADNSLSGPIPGSLQRFAPEYFAGNGGLCGAPLDRKCKRRFHVRIHIRLRRINNASSIGAAAGFIVGFVVAFYFPHWFVFCGGLRPYIVPVCG
ncbi:hypothetical protein SETIT_5G410000v2 [Setaria italica]|uniref:Leucine-rich repeat-containing N-terminal plant-type domain-containing protein n=1 Tax=Setaria italica TaxID=4555 RepID=A0A368REG0_SETIT|nr:hypothetical protein SETIT_5G410000v2 [Setaria italica]